MTNNRSDSIFWGIVIIIIGILFMIKNLGWAHINIWRFIGTYWPMILIYIGLKNILIYFNRNR